MSILKIENLSHKYGSKWAVKEINLNIDNPGVVGLLGINGAGKSTIMNIICGTLKQTHGDVWIKGKSIKTQAVEAKKEIGYLPQTLPLYEDLTVNEFLIYSAELRLIKDSKIKEAVELVKEKCQLTHISNRLIKNLSGGYKQRVGIAQSIIHNPSLVVMDEPTVGLDPNQLVEVRKLIKELGQQHCVLLSSHILSEIQLLCEEIIMIDHGRLVYADSINAFRDHVAPNSLKVSFKNPPILMDFENLIKANKIEQIQENEFRVFMNEQEDLTDAIMLASIQNNWKLMEISQEKAKLDEIFDLLSAKSNDNF